MKGDDLEDDDEEWQKRKMEGKEKMEGIMCGGDEEVGECTCFSPNVC